MSDPRKVKRASRKESKQPAHSGVQVASSSQSLVGSSALQPTTQAPMPPAVPLDPETEQRVKQLVNEGNMLRSRNKLAEAIELYNMALSLDPTNVTAVNCKGVCYKQMGRNAEAMLCYRDALQMKPDDWRAHNNRGVIYKESGLFQEAIDSYALALEYYNRQPMLPRIGNGIVSPVPSASRDAGEMQMPCDVDKDSTIQHVTHSTEGVPDEAGNTEAENTGNHVNNEVDNGPLITDCISEENMAIVLTDLGTRLKVAGNVDAAVMRYNEAIRYNPRYAPAYFNLGVVYSENNRFTDALKFYHAAVDRNAGYVEALCNIGVICKNAGQLESAIQFYERALKLNPNFTIANSNLAIAYTDMGTKVKNEGRIDEGIRLYQKSLVHNPKYSDAWYNLGVAHAEKGKTEDAMVCYEMAITFNPNCAQAFNNLGVLYKDRGNLEKSIYFYQEALKANPNFAQTLNNLGVIYTMLGKLDEAYSFCQRAISTNPSYAEAFNNLGVLYRDEGRIREAIACYNNCLRLDTYSRSAGQNRLLAMNSLVPESRRGQSTPTTPTLSAGIGNAREPAIVLEDDATALERPLHTFASINKRVFEHHRAWGLQFAGLYPASEYWENAPTCGPQRPIRIGYVSADFFTHSVSYFIEAPLRFANHERFHIVCYSNVGREDKKTHRLKKLTSAWRSIVGKSSKEVAAMVRKDQIDILVDLTGHTAGNRLDVFAHRPAPLQVSWIGYPNTTGLPTIDYRFSDEIADPLDTKQEYVEELVRLPGPFLCYTPMHPAPAVSPPPALRNGFVTFGSFNNLAKINDRVLSLWAKILVQVPNSLLVMKCKPFASESIRQKMLSRFEALNVDPKRVDLIPLLPSTGEHLKVYSLVDISVDTFPYAGTTTTCESLFMGVPVITLQAKSPSCSHAHNVGASLLHRIDFMREFIAGSDEEYVSKAVALAKNINKLSDVRRRLRPSMLSSSLCDGPTFMQGLEQVYVKIWERWCDKARLRTQ